MTRTTSTAADRRQWLIATLLKGEGVNRKIIMRAFGASRGTATQDLRSFSAEFPGLLSYDKHQKVHRASYSALMMKFLPVVDIGMDREAA